MSGRPIPQHLQRPWIWFGIVLVALLLRAPRLSQSLWYDEMYTLTEYVDGPWHKVLASRPGEYVPNNHVLHTVLAKAVYALGPRGELEGLGPSETLLRLPAMLAGTVLPIALAWPLRRAAPVAAFLLATLAALHPWLLAFSVEARGYTLMLLFSVLATQALPDGRHRWPIAYPLCLAGAIYTIPIALLLVPAHAVVITTLRKQTLATWARGTSLGLLLTMLLYLPLLPAMRQYARNPYEATLNYAQFVDQLPRFALTGENAHGRWAWAFSVLLLVVGTPQSWRSPALRPLLVTMAVTTALGVLLPIGIAGAAEVRFVPWIALWLCVAVTGLILAAPRWLALAAIVICVAAMIGQDLRLLPHQPVRDALAAADHLAPAGCDLMVGYLGATETAYLYGPQQSHRVLFGPDQKQWLAAEVVARRETGSNPWVVISYEDLLLRRLNEPTTRGLWLHLQRDYDCVLRLPGRISPVAVYKPRDLNSPRVADARF